MNEKLRGITPPKSYIKDELDYLLEQGLEKTEDIDLRSDAAQLWLKLRRKNEKKQQSYRSSKP